jgi:hypothetical protein
MKQILINKAVTFNANLHYCSQFFNDFLSKKNVF